MKYVEPTEEQLALWKEWLAERPEEVRKVAERFDPWTLYRMKSTGQRVTLLAVGEDGTVRVNVTGEFNLLSHERAVFGIDPDDLVECDLPGDDEPLGTFDLTVDEVKKYMSDKEQRAQPLAVTIGVSHKLRTYPRNWRTK